MEVSDYVIMNDNEGRVSIKSGERETNSYRKDGFVLLVGLNGVRKSKNNTDCMVYILVN
jgi:hypothetical protein